MFDQIWSKKSKMVSVSNLAIIQFRNNSNFKGELSYELGSPNINFENNSKIDIDKIKDQINRTRWYSINYKHLCMSLLPWSSFKCLSSKIYRKQNKLFSQAKLKFKSELDCISIIKSIRQLKILIDIQMTENQILLNQFHRN